MFEQMVCGTEFENSQKKTRLLAFVLHSSGDKRRNEPKKNSIDFLIKLNEDDWMFEKDQPCDQRKIFKLQTNSFWRHKFGLHDLM